MFLKSLLLCLLSFTAFAQEAVIETPPKAEETKEDLKIVEKPQTEVERYKARAKNPLFGIVSAKRSDDEIVEDLKRLNSAIIEKALAAVNFDEEAKKFKEIQAALKVYHDGSLVHLQIETARRLAAKGIAFDIDNPPKSKSVLLLVRSLRRGDGNLAQLAELLQVNENAAIYFSAYKDKNLRDGPDVLNEVNDTSFADLPFIEDMLSDKYIHLNEIILAQIILECETADNFAKFKVCKDPEITKRLDEVKSGLLGHPLKRRWLKLQGLEYSVLDDEGKKSLSEALIHINKLKALVEERIRVNTFPTAERSRAKTEIADIERAIRSFDPPYDEDVPEEDSAPKEMAN